MLDHVLSDFLSAFQSLLVRGGEMDASVNSRHCRLFRRRPKVRETAGLQAIAFVRCINKCKVFTKILRQHSGRCA